MTFKKRKFGLLYNNGWRRFSLIDCNARGSCGICRGNHAQMLTSAGLTVVITIIGHSKLASKQICSHNIRLALANNWVNTACLLRCVYTILGGDAGSPFKIIGTTSVYAEDRLGKPNNHHDTLLTQLIHYRSVERWLMLPRGEIN